MRATTHCIQCRSELLLIAHEPGAAVTCPTCQLTWVPAADEVRPAAGPPADRPRPPAPPRLRKPQRAVDPEPLPMDEDPPRRGVNPLVFVAVAGVFFVLLAGGGAAAWLVLGQKKADDTAQADPPKPAEKEKEKPAKPDEVGKGTGPVVVSGTDPIVPPPALSGEQVYRRLLRSTVFLVVPKNGGGVGLGSGVLVHADRRLVVTNFHVVRGAEDGRAVALFPAYKDDKDPITAVSYYVDNAKKLGIPGRVAHGRGKKDLAVLELDRVPEGVRPISFAAKPAPTGAAVYSIGASGVERNLLWKLTTGTVSGRSEQKLDAPWGPVSATILETNAGVNPGDSGGPVVNNRAELVGLVSHFDRTQRDVSGNIDLEEVRAVMTEFAEKDGWAWADPGAGGNTFVADEPEDVSRLVDQLSNADAGRRLDAARRLGALGVDAKPAVPALLAKLDDPDDKVRRAVDEALEKVGPPLRADLGAVDAALRSGGPNARLFALRFYADPKRKVPESHLADVVKALSDPSAETRKTAVRTLANYGPGCKPKALEALFDRTADEDPTVADEAVKAVAKFAPFDENDRAVLVKILGHAKPQLRAVAVRLLTDAVPDAPTAVRWFRPRLADEDPRVRLRAVEALAKWGPAAKECLPDLLERTADGSPAVAAAAARTVGAMGGGRGAVEALGKLVRSADAPAEVKAAAAEAVLALDPTDAGTDIPVLVVLLGFEDPPTRAGALGKLARYGKAAKVALGPITERLTDADRGVQVAALKAVAAVGPDAAGAIPAVAALLDGKQPDKVGVAAADTLARLGPKSIDPLTRALDARLSKDVLVRVCEALGGFGRDAQSAGPALLDAIARQPALGELGAEAWGAVATRRAAWSPDPVAAAVAKVGGDKVAKQLIEWTQYEVRAVGGAKVKRTKHGDGVQLWSICVLGSLDPDTLSDDGKKLVAERLDFLAGFDPNPVCKDAAKTGQARHPVKKK